MQRLSDEQNKNRYEACEKSSWEIENRLYRSLNSSQIKKKFIIKLKHWRSHWYYAWCHEFRWIHRNLESWHLQHSLKPKKESKSRKIPDQHRNLHQKMCFGSSGKRREGINTKRVRSSDWRSRKQIKKIENSQNNSEKFWSNQIMKYVFFVRVLIADSTQLSLLFNSGK